MKSLVGCCGLILAVLLSCTLTGVKTTSPPRPVLSPQGTDCTEIKARNPRATSGVYVIKPPKVRTPFKVFCVMGADGGWTVFQRRTGGDVSFNRNWAQYKEGFGRLTEDHWLGLEKVYSLTKDKTKKWTLRVDLWDHKGSTAYAQYESFRLGSEKQGFKLHVGKFIGNAGDAIRGAYEGIDQNGFGFSTVDRDNDGCSPCIFGDIAENECTFSSGGGWWYSRCGSASLNSDWHSAADNKGWASGIYWDTWKTKQHYSLMATRMMIKSE